MRRLYYDSLTTVIHGIPQRMLDAAAPGVEDMRSAASTSTIPCTSA